MVDLPRLELATVYEVVVGLLLEAVPLGGDVAAVIVVVESLEMPG